MLKVQSVSLADRQKAIELLNFYLLESNQQNLNYQFKKKAANSYLDIYFKLQQTSKVYFKGLYQNQKLLSLLMCRVERNPFITEEKILFIEFAITKFSQRNKGYMKILLGDLYDFAKKQSIANLQLRAFVHNENSLNFWKKMGFENFSICMTKNLLL